MHAFCISQGTAVTVFRFGVQVLSHLREIYSGLMYQKSFRSVNFWLSCLKLKCGRF